MAAFEPGDAALDQRRVGPAEPVRHARKAIGVRTRKSPCQIGLFGREHIHRVTLGVLERCEAARAARKAPEDSGGSSETELNELAVKPT